MSYVESAFAVCQGLMQCYYINYLIQASQLTKTLSLNKLYSAFSESSSGLCLDYICPSSVLKNPTKSVYQESPSFDI